MDKRRLAKIEQMFYIFEREVGVGCPAEERMDDRDIEAIIEALQRVREEEFLSLRGLAKRLGFSPSHLSMILAHKRRPGKRFLWAAAQRVEEIRRLLAARFEETKRPPRH